MADDLFKLTKILYVKLKNNEELLHRNFKMFDEMAGSFIFDAVDTNRQQSMENLINTTSFFCLPSKSSDKKSIKET